MEYSAVRHVCESVWFNHSLSERLLLMFVSYFADSSDGRSVIVSGCAATADRWLAFEAEWGKHLAASGLEYFHMKEFGKNVACAHAWGDNKQKYCDFLQGCAAIIKKHVNFGMS